MRFVLVPSPLLPESGWDGVARVLREDGHEARVLDVGAPVDGDVAGYVARAVAALDAIAGGGSVLVPHSGAGLLAPALAAAGRVTGIVFVDAALPPTSGTAPLAPQDLVDALLPLADEAGALPPWTEWWDETQTATLYPDPSTRAQIGDAARPVPVAWLTAEVDVPPRWTGLPAAYLAFGDTYAEEVSVAERRGWPVERMPGGHLHQLHDPAGVASAIVRLAPPG